MIKALLHIRFKQLYRSFLNIGILRLLFVLAFLSFCGFQLFQMAKELKMAIVLCFSFLLAIGVLHFRRADRYFLQCHFTQYKLLMACEYVILSLPLLFCLIWHQHWISIPVLLGIGPLSHIFWSPKQTNQKSFLLHLLPDDCIEWKSALRNYFYVFSLLWLTGAFTSFFIAAVPITIFILGILSFTTFEKCESLNILLAYEKSPRQLLLQKVMRQIQIFSLLIVPLLLLFILFHPDKWYIGTIEFVMFLFLQVYAVFCKYAFFQANEKPAISTLFMGLGTLGMFIPFLSPLVIILTFWFYNKSVRKLNFYLDDFNS